MKRALLMLVVTSLVFLISAPTYGQMGGGGEEYGKMCGGEGPSHDTHTQGIAKGPDPLSCHDCHGRKCKKEFADGEPLATTTVCNNCHSQGGAFDGVQMAKDNWDSGVYEADGSLKSGNEYWCASCHDADQASSNQDGSGEVAPDISGDDSSYGYYVTGHGRENEYPLMYYQGGSGNGNPGANLVCAHCHDSTSEHIVAGQSVTRLKSGYENDQSNSNCNQCHPPGTWATADPELYTNSDEYEAAHHGDKRCAECHEVHGMVAEAYPAMAIGGARTLCLSCHDGTTAPAVSEPPAAHGEASEAACSSCHNPHMPAHGAGAEGVGCKSCHGHDAGYEYEPGQFSQGAGTYKSHSTHTEGDSDDLKGPHIACDICHDTNSYPNFTDGAASLATTTVCNNCHSGGGAFPGAVGLDDPVTGAKANWATGVYAGNGTTLQSGKEQWCATCHDDVPAYIESAAIIVDNLDAEFVCDWGTSPSGGYNNDYRWHAAGDGSCTATWTPDIPEAGNYNVYAWWKASPNRATDAKYTIYYDDGLGNIIASDPIEVNQKENGSQWNQLGTETYYFAKGTSGYVVLSDDANEYVIADAISLVESGGSPVASIYAPNVTGDNTTYGFYVSGHKINCLSCHDANKKHIDHDPRTYEVNESTGAVVNPYADSYRLSGTSSKPSQGFCFGCHNSTEVLGQNSSDVSHTNFWNDDEIVNSHNLHLGFSGPHFDSDWDGVHDSRESCITCHNVHGVPNQAMIRHGELISTPGTTDKVPALDFAYLLAPTVFDTATWTPDIPEAGDYKVYAWWKASSNRATDAKYTIYYDDGLGNTVSDTIEVNQEENGNQWNQLGTGTYYFAAGTSGYVVLSDDANEFVIADAVGWDSNLDGTPDIIIDNGDSEFDSVGDWTCPSGSGIGYGDDCCYAKGTPEPDPDASLPESVGGRMGGFTGVCSTCHGAISYLRTPYLGPKVLMGKAEPDTVAKDGSGTSLITVFILDHDDDPMNISVTMDLSTIGGDPDQAMTYDGDGIFSYQVTIPADTPDSPLTFMITATDDDTNTGEGTATVGVVDPDSIYVDNQDAEFVCDWSTSLSGGYNNDYRWHAAGDGSCTATWTPDIPEAGNYNVYAWWKASPNRATDAPYTIYYDGGSETVDVNQQINGNQWVLLGTYPFVAGQSGYVVLSDDANQYVIADAIKLVPQP